MAHLKGHNLRNALMQRSAAKLFYIRSAIKNGGMIVVSYNFLSYSVRRILPLDIYGMVQVFQGIIQSCKEANLATFVNTFCLSIMMADNQKFNGLSF